MRHLVQVGDALAAATDDVAAVHRILAEAMLDLPADWAAVWALDTHGGLELVEVRHGDTGRAASLRQRLAAVDPLAGPGSLEEVLRTGDAVRATRPGLRDLQVPAGLAALARDHRVTSAVLAPVVGRRGALGVVLAARCGTGLLSAADADFALALARRAGVVLETARLIEEVSCQAAVLDSVSDAVIAVDRDQLVTTWNAAAERMYGIASATALGRPLGELVADDTCETEELHPVSAPIGHGGALEQAVRLGGWRGRVRQTSSAGLSVDVETSLAVRRDGRGEYDGLVAVNRDLTEVLAARAAARAQETFTRDLMDALDSRAAVLDGNGHVVSANTRWRAGMAERDRCVCGPVPEGTDWLGGLRDCSLGDVTDFAAEVEQVLRGERALARLECRCLDAGPERATAIEVARLHGVGDGAVVVQSDVSWRRRLEDELTHRATHDELTGLPNRAALMERLQASVRRLDGQTMLAVLFCDLDGFKDINDGLGHAVGDQVLVAVARRLRQRCRQADVVARFGGDEFVVVLPVDDIGKARATAERLVEALGEPIAVGDAEVAPGASIGVTVVDRMPEGDDPVGTLLRDADTAMYHAKERGRGRHELFTARLRVDISERLEYASALRRAVGNQELDLIFQTRRYCGDRRVAGVEALIRWRHKELGPVPPATFIPIAERTGRIVEVGGWALQQALQQMAELEDRRLTVAVNVSPRQLVAPRMVEQVDEALAASGLEPWRLVLEITEGALLDDPLLARTVLTDLRRLGVTIALDDFGTGWSSMSYLRTLPVDVIKIDRTFVADLPHDPDACAVVAAVLGLGHGMGLVVVAEGVEAENQLDVLRDMGCDEYQGFIDGLPGALPDVLAVEP
ncbi:MAG TPA: EAL domain-containing protein [Kineosporiaceae bacterium]|nr:EAL domain-containing protein [Kineosporiaceae bacterium]